MVEREKVALVYLSLIHYRKTVFENLWNNTDVDFHIVCSADSPYVGMKNFSPEGRYRNAVSYIRLSTFRLFKHLFIFQTGGISALMKERPTHIILLGFDPHIVSSIWIFLFARYLLRKKVYWWGHGVTGNQGRLGVAVRRFFYNRSNGILVYSNQGRKELTGMGVKRPVVVVGNALNNEDYGFRNNVISKEYDLFRIIFSGRLVKSKQVDLLIQALQYLKDSFPFECTIIGDGPERQQLEGLISDKQLGDQVKITGALYGAALTQYYLNAHVCVIPGDAGLGLIHALSFGAPVITHNDLRTHGPEIEVLQEGVNGDFYKKNDVNDLKEKIIKWREQVFLKKAAICSECIEGVKNIGYTPEMVAKNILSIMK